VTGLQWPPTILQRTAARGLAIRNVREILGVNVIRRDSAATCAGCSAKAELDGV
jgi:hypothetical protein